MNTREKNLEEEDILEEKNFQEMIKKHIKKVSLLGFVALPMAIIQWLILDLIFERDLPFGLFKSISFGLVYGITWMVTYRFGIKRGWKIFEPVESNLHKKKRKEEKNRKKEN